MVVEGPGKLEMTFTPADGGKPQQFTIYDFKGALSLSFWRLSGGWVAGVGVVWLGGTQAACVSLCHPGRLTRPACLT